GVVDRAPDQVVTLHGEGDAVPIHAVGRRRTVCLLQQPVGSLDREGLKLEALAETAVQGEPWRLLLDQVAVRPELKLAVATYHRVDEGCCYEGPDGYVTFWPGAETQAT